MHDSHSIEILKTYGQKVYYQVNISWTLLIFDIRDVFML